MLLEHLRNIFILKNDATNIIDKQLKTSVIFVAFYHCEAVNNDDIGMCASLEQYSVERVSLSLNQQMSNVAREELLCSVVVTSHCPS